MLLSFLFATSIAALTIALPGGLIAWALRARGYTAAIIAVPAAFASIAVAAIIAPLLHIPWGPLPVVGFAVLLSLCLLALRRFIPKQNEPVTRVHRAGWPLFMTLAAATVFSLRFLGELPALDAISQSYDAIFHLNATQHILQTGSASSFEMNLSSPGAGGFYPAVWHAVVSLVVQLTGASIPLATNATVVVVAGAVWPLGAIGLARAVAGPSKRTSLIAATLAVALPSMPFALAAFGVLYPNLLSVALLPYVFIALLQLFAVGRARTADPMPPFTRWLLLFGAFGATALAHPNALHATLMLLGPLVLVSVIATWRSPRTATSSWLALIAVLAFVTASGLAWFFGRSGLNPWDGRHNLWGAFLDGLGSTPHQSGANWLVTVALLIGLVVAIAKKSTRSLVLIYLVFLAVYVVADGLAVSRFRSALLSPWYSDPWRIAALLPLIIIPLATLGLVTLSGAVLPSLRRGLRVGFSFDTIPVRRIAGAVLALLAVTAILGSGFSSMREYIKEQYDDGAEAKLLSQDERVVIDRLDKEVPPGATILTNPWNGGSLVFALTGRPVLVPHAGARLSPEIATLVDGIAEGTPAACAIADELDVNYVLDFGDRFVMDAEWNANFTKLESISGMVNPPALSVVTSEGDATLYRVTGCE